MFWCVLVTEIDTFFKCSDFDDQTLLDGFFGNLDSWQGSCLDIDLFFNLVEEFGRQVDGDKDDLRVGSVFCL